MSQKTCVYIGLFAFSTIGSWIGAAIDHGNWLGALSVAGCTIGAFVGIWAGYKLGKRL